MSHAHRNIFNGTSDYQQCGLRRICDKSQRLAGHQKAPGKFLFSYTSVEITLHKRKVTSCYCDYRSDDTFIIIFAHHH